MPGANSPSDIRHPPKRSRTALGDRRKVKNVTKNALARRTTHPPVAMVGGTRRLGARGRCGTWQFRAAAGSRQPYGVRSRPRESPQRREPLTTNSTEVASARRGRGAVWGAPVSARGEGTRRLGAGGRRGDWRATPWLPRCRLDALGFLVELQKLCRMEDGFALVVTHWNSPSTYASSS
jgi:hypothetical protein